MDKVYNHKEIEEKIYKMWEEKGYFKPEVNPKGKPYTIILPPPNANAPLHFGHAMMSVEDILIRYHRMKGDKALFLPGADHAGFETQYVFEKLLQKEGKSRFDYDRETLYKMIWDHVQKNKKDMENQLRRLGFSLDWSREKFTLDQDIVEIVYKTFKKMYDESLIYRGERLVNYCTKCGTSFSDLEVISEEQEGTLYFIRYDSITVATTRPETMFGDVAVMVNPKDKRYSKQIGKEAEIPIVNKKVPIIADESVDMSFGTGSVKVTPAHDFNDYEVGKRHNLPIISVIGFDGQMQNTNFVDGLYPRQAREKTVDKLKEMGVLEKEEKHKIVVKKCYKCKTPLEPLLLPQWYVKVKPLVEKAIEVIKNKKIRIYPNRFEKIYFHWLENLHDWNISRQIVWGIRVPAYRCRNVKCQMSNVKSKNNSSNETMKQSNNEVWIVTNGNKPDNCPKCGSKDLEQDPDTFDTWFSSSQWPFATLMTNCNCKGSDGFFDAFYPTSVMETGYDILKAWVSRMVMMGIYRTGKIPFYNVVLHGLVNDPYGKKMSKSKGNVINPIEIADLYGADALRMALVYATALGNDQALSYPKLQAMRNFTNKLWNIARFVQMKREVLNPKSEIQNNLTIEQLNNKAMNKTDKEMIEKVLNLVKEITRYLDSYQFNFASEKLYDFIWHEFADKYIEDVKNRIDENSFIVLNSLFIILLKLLHPMMPFVTEEIYQRLGGEGSIMISKWPSK